MKLNSHYLTHETRGEHYLISTADASFKGIIKSNDTAGFIVECLKNDTTEPAIVDRILEEYEGVSRDTVEQDVAAIIGKLRSIGVLDE